ncbi:unnamed protein product [Linum tenue]|nr:unnamed protein product [Linum tenue]
MASKNNPRVPSAQVGSALVKFGVAAGIAVYAAANSLYNVEGGHRAIVFNRITGIKNRTFPEGTHFIFPWFEVPIIYDVRARPHLVESTSGSRDLQMFLHWPISGLFPMVVELDPKLILGTSDACFLHHHMALVHPMA